MKDSFKKRIENLENILQIKSNQKRYVRILYDADSDFDPSTFKIDGEFVIFLPDKGLEPIDFSTQPYKIFYG